MCSFALTWQPEDWTFLTSRTLYRCVLACVCVGGGCVFVCVCMCASPVLLLLIFIPTSL